VRTRNRDLVVGVFVLIGLLAIAYLSFAVGGAAYGGNGGLELKAAFDEIGGLTVRSPVVIGGVKVGTVDSIELGEGFRPIVHMDIDASLQLPDDTSAAILTQGVLGDQYIGLQPGGSDELLKPGDSIEFTQSAVILERLIGRVLQSFEGGDSSSGSGSGSGSSSGGGLQDPSSSKGGADPE
jgi:phospholipid/cholesterol/gamma-HCH transport system substrate-binding protein